MSTCVAKFDLTLLLTELDYARRAGWDRGEFEYSTDLFERERRALAAHLHAPVRAQWRRRTGRSAGIDASRRRGAAAGAGRVERHRGACPGRRRVHALIEAQVARARRDAVAVVCEDATLTYAELNARANRLAHQLSRARRRARLIGRAVRSSARPSWSSALLAILKAGGAYVPLDPAYPADRLAFMLGDASAATAGHHAVPPPAQSARGRPLIGASTIPTPLGVLATSARHRPA